MITTSYPTTQIHPTATLDPSACLEANVVVGPYVTIGQQAHIQAGTQIGPHAVIGDYTRIGRNCKIYSHAVVGSPSQDLKYQGGVSFLEIGDGNIIREFTTLNRATAEGGITRLGSNNLLMAYAHVAHDCQIGNGVVLANGVTLGGHVVLEDEAVLGAMTGIHQFVRIGRLAMIGAMSRICQDVPPFMLTVGSPPKVYGINAVGLRRRQVPAARRQILKQAYQLIYRKDLTLSHALDQMAGLSASPELAELVTFLLLSRRGICGLRGVTFPAEEFS